LKLPSRPAFSRKSSGKSGPAPLSRRLNSFVSASTSNAPSQVAGSIFPEMRSEFFSPFRNKLWRNTCPEENRSPENPHCRSRSGTRSMPLMESPFIRPSPLKRRDEPSPCSSTANPTWISPDNPETLVLSTLRSASSTERTAEGLRIVPETSPSRTTVPSIGRCSPFSIFFRLVWRN